ncbi:hypothetical protein [Bacillus sp. 1P06AnD]|uniref:hypothetical protein n=1 Tax=Bacillus sp. 1P06AnD TaxID=3132208 RepID=UPI0039A3E842
MKCRNCGHENEGGKFCEKCGTKLEDARSEVAAASATQQEPVKNQPSQYIESTKKISKMYFSYFLDVLKHPYANSQSVNKEYMVNGIITIILFSLFIPLMTYFGLKGLMSNFNEFGSDLFGVGMDMAPPFTAVVVKPFFAYLIFIALVITFTFAAVRFGRVNVGYTDVVARFGSFLIPFVLLLAIGLIFSILKVKFFLFFLSLGFMGAIFIIPPLVIASYKRNSKSGMDVIYGSLLTYLLTIISIFIMADMLMEALKSAMQDLFGMF